MLSNYNIGRSLRKATLVVCVLLTVVTLWVQVQQSEHGLNSMSVDIKQQINVNFNKQNEDVSFITQNEDVSFITQNEDVSFNKKHGNVKHENVTFNKKHGNVKHENVTFNKKQENVTFIYNTSGIRECIENIHKNYYKPAAGDNCTERNPHVIIVGVSKCGTRELSDLMAMHPQMVTKGTDGQYKIDEDYFNTESLRHKVKSKMPCTYADQIGSMKQDFFFLHSNVPASIAALDNRTKIIVLVREPVERTIAHKTFRAMKHNVGTEGLAFSKIIRSDKHTGALKVNSVTTFVKASEYSECLKRYLEYFPFEQILIVETKDFSKDPLTVMAEVERFLGVEPFAYDDHLVLNSETGFNCVRETVDATEAVCYDHRRGRGGSTGPFISDTERQVLVDYFRPFNKELFRLINKTYTHWIL